MLMQYIIKLAHNKNCYSQVSSAVNEFTNANAIPETVPLSELIQNIESIYKDFFYSPDTFELPKFNFAELYKMNPNFNMKNQLQCFTKSGITQGVFMSLVQTDKDSAFPSNYVDQVKFIEKNITVEKKARIAFKVGQSAVKFI